MSEEVEIDRGGNFRGRILSYGIQEASQSKAVSVSMRVAIDEAYNEETGGWDDWRSHNVRAWAASWIIGKSGDVNDKAVESLSKATGWGGSFLEITEQTWQPDACQFFVKGEDYNGKTTYKVAFLNPYDAPVGGGNLNKIDADKAKALQTQYGSKFKAIAANAKRNAGPANGKPKAPPPAPVGAGAGKKTIDANGDEIPF
jgi:hypothetical protein